MGMRRKFSAECKREAVALVSQPALSANIDETLYS